MKTIFHTFVCLFMMVALTNCSNTRQHPQNESIEAIFTNAPDSIQTSIYWYWISDHISEEGVVKDLHAMKEKGINRAFIGNIGLSDGESGVGNIKFYSEEWWRVLHTALRTATELGIEIGIFNSPGWSQSGGPWVKPEQAMRYLASTTTQSEGGRLISLTLPKPDHPYKAHFQDVKVIAYPSIENKHALLTLANTDIRSTPALSGISAIMDGNKSTEVLLANSNEKQKNVTIDFKAKEPFLLRSVKIYATQAAINCPAKIEVKENNSYKTVTEFIISRYNSQLNVGFDPYAPIVLSIPETTATEFRLVLPEVTPGSGIKEIEFASTPIVERYPEKTMAKMFQSPLPYWHEYQWDPQPVITDKSLVVDPSNVLDISDHLKGDLLTWDAPEGHWNIMRMGMLPTGVTNSPARPEATGLEIDKMSKQHVETHFEAFLGEIYRRIPEADRACWKVVVQDSYETGGQNFTDEFLTAFKERYGYDPIPFLPVYAGTVVESEDISDRFLWDMRRLVADKVAYDYVGGLREVCHKYGLTTWLENYGHWGFPGEFLQYGGQSDEIGGEFWSEGELGDIENRAASSCGHIYGKNRISAESFTAGGGGYHRYPAMMKQRGDRFFSEGINNTLLHLYIAQPYEDREPGVNATFANEFNRKNTWYPHLDLFTAYLKRTNFMLQQGTNIADVAYFIGEDAPKMTGITDPALPKGYQFDYINAEVIERDMQVKNGLLTLPHGTQYRLLVLPKLETMRPELLRKIQQLLEDGATILGPAPLRSPSYANYPLADQEVQQIAHVLWSNIDPASGYAKIGKGTLIDGMTMEDALALINCVPDCKLSPDDPVLYGHRSLEGMEIYFISNQSDQKITIRPELRVKGFKPELWEATTGSIRPLPAYSTTPTGTLIPMKLDAFESVFLVFREKAPKDPDSNDIQLNYPTAETLLTINEPWLVSFEESRRGPATPLLMNELADLTSFKDYDIQHYSGQLIYTTHFNLEQTPVNERLYLNLNDVTAMAKVNINGHYAGGVWTPPYRVDITDYVTKGKNNIEIEVTTTWKNRLIGDLKLPENERKTWVAYQPWRATEPLQKSGLIGPVTLEKYTYKKE